MNQRGVFSGQTDTPLTDEGRAQSIAAGQKLANTRIDLIVASPIARAYDTAVIIASEIGYNPANILTNDHFIERSFGPLEGTEYSTNVDLDGTHGVEHSDDLLKRVHLGYDFLKTLDADTILVVSHGAVGRALRSLVQDETPFHGSERFSNAQVVKLL